MPKVTHLIVMCDNQSIGAVCKDFPSSVKVMTFTEVEILGAEPDNSRWTSVTPGAIFIKHLRKKTEDMG